MSDFTPSTGSQMEPQQAFLQLGRLDLSQLTLTEVLAEVASLARASVPGADEVSVTLIEAERARTVAFTGSLAVHLDERQYARGFGPCMDAAISGDTITIKDTATDDRYPDFGPVAARAGMHSTLSVGMPVPQRIVGGLSFYARIPDAFDQASVDMAQAFAAYGAVAWSTRHCWIPRSLSPLGSNGRWSPAPSSSRPRASSSPVRAATPPKPSPSWYAVPSGPTSNSRSSPPSSSAGPEPPAIP